MKKWGIDISRWQKGLQLSAFRHCEFVIIKAGGSDDGHYIDSRFLDFYSQAKNLGWPVGIYWYTKAVTINGLKEDINFLLDNIKGLQFELPVYLDLEESCLYYKSAELAAYWLNTLSERGYYPGIYTGYAWWIDQLKNLACDPVQRWVALWNEEDPGMDCGMWQDGHITTWGMEIDSDYMLADFTFIKDNGMNGFKEKQYFSDVTAERSDYRAIQWLAASGAVKGYSDGTFRPDQPVTRGQLATILWRMAGRPDE